MIKKLGIAELLSAVIKKVEENTAMRCYDYVASNTPSPFYFVEVVGKRADNTKTMYCEIFTVFIHAISTVKKGSVEIYKLIELLEESLTEDITLPDGIELLMQTEQGLQTIKTDETKEKHAVLVYEFRVCYGFKTKN